MVDRIIAEGRHLRLVDRDGWELAERRGVSGVVAIVAITPDERLILTEQWRAPVGRSVIDLPAGLAGDIPGEEHEALSEAARRELVEEVGFDAKVLALLAACPTSPGLSSEVVTFFLATELSRVGEGGGAGSESITVHEVPLTALAAWCREREGMGALIDLKLWAGLRLAGR